MAIARSPPFERRLNQGIDDIDAGRCVSREQSPRKIEKLLAFHKAKKGTSVGNPDAIGDSTQLPRRQP
jgi:uncharacterized protein YjcR